MWAAAEVAAHAAGAGRRRRERRLRQFLRHERLSVAMALAEFTNHSAPRRPTMARAREEESEMNFATGQMTPPPKAASTVHFNLFDDGDVLAARPDRLYEVRPQLGVLWHTGAHSVDLSPFMQIHDIPVPQMGGEQVVEFMKELDSPALDEQVIAVPKISLDRVSKRCPRRLPRRVVERLVEVPTIISYSSLLQRNVEQTIDIPVPHDHGGRGGGGGLQIFSQGQGTTACRGAEFVDIPVPQGRGGLGGGGLQSFSQDQGSTAVFGADLVDNPVPHGRVGGGGEGSSRLSPRTGLSCLFISRLESC